MRYILVLAWTMALAFISLGCQQKPQEPLATENPPLPLQPPTKSQRQSLAETQPSPAAPATVETKDTVEVTVTSEYSSKPYTIRAGDVGFYAIARKLYGDPRRAKEIQALNPGVDSRKLKIGQVINVPAK